MQNKGSIGSRVPNSEGYIMCEIKGKPLSDNKTESIVSLIEI
jgi:hypothetical protein